MEEEQQVWQRQRPTGRPCKGDKPLAVAERSKVYREKEKPEDLKEMRKKFRKRSLNSLSKDQMNELKKKDRERKRAKKEEAQQYRKK